MKRSRSWLVSALSLLGFALGCQSPDKGPQTSSESHFLTSCNASCGDGFACLCGVCTKPCDSDATCSALAAGAECVEVASRPQAASCPAADGAGFCDLRCSADADCHALGGDFGCEAGFCRQGVQSSVPSERVELDQICPIYVADTCRAKIDCYGWDYASYDACVASQECDGFAELNSLLAAGSATYDPVATATCAKELAADPCMFGAILFAVPTLPEALSYCGALVGQRAAGASCDQGVECAPGLECNVDASCPGTCEAPPQTEDLPQGAACVTEICVPAQAHCSECALGLECVNQVCIPTPQVGDTCTTLLGCADALWCDLTAGHCAPRAKLGEACSDFRQVAPNCEDGLWCDDPPASPETSGTCMAPAAKGEPCRADANCIAPYSCEPSAGATPLDRGTCGDKLDNGAACDSFDDCASGRCSMTNTCIPQAALGEACVDTCAEGLTCASSVCATKRYAGQACGATDSCVNSRCMSGTCAVRAHFGDACAVDDDCLSAHCDGTCVDPVGCVQ